MIQRIINWYNGYTLEEKLELEYLEQYAICQLMIETTIELNEMIVCYPISGSRGLLREEIIWDPNNFHYTPVFNIYEYGITNYNIEKVYIKQLWEGLPVCYKSDNLSLLQRIKLLNEPNSIFRIKMNIRNNKGLIQVCKEYCIKDLQKLKLLKELSL